jgi:hypothetical protein
MSQKRIDEEDHCCDCKLFIQTWTSDKGEECTYGCHGGPNGKNVPVGKCEGKTKIGTHSACKSFERKGQGKQLLLLQD